MTTMTQKTNGIHLRASAGSIPGAVPSLSHSEAAGHEGHEAPAQASRTPEAPPDRPAGDKADHERHDRPDPYAGFSVAQLDAMIAGITGRIGRMYGSREASPTWFESVAFELAALRRDRFALFIGAVAGGPVMARCDATLEPSEPNPYSRFTLEELDAMIAAAIGRRERLVAGPSETLEDLEGLLGAESAEIAAMREARDEQRPDSPGAENTGRGVSGSFDAITVFCEEGDHQRIEFAYHSGADGPAAVLKLHVHERDRYTRLVGEAGKAALYDAFLFAMTDGQRSD